MLEIGNMKGNPVGKIAEKAGSQSVIFDNMALSYTVFWRFCPKFSLPPGPPGSKPRWLLNWTLTLKGLRKKKRFGWTSKQQISCIKKFVNKNNTYPYWWWCLLREFSPRCWLCMIENSLQTSSMVSQSESWNAKRRM